MDIAKLKLIPIASILKMYGIPVFKRSDTEYVCDCPLASHTESSKEHRRSFSMGINKKQEYKWLCHSTNCQRIGNHHGGDGIDLVARLDNLTPKDAMVRLSELFAVAQPNPPSKVLLENKPLAFELKHLTYHPMIAERGITEETAKSFGSGFQAKASMANRICFPLYEDGNLMGYIGRTTLEVTPENPKWKMGCAKTMLFGLERCEPSKPLVLVESPWGVLWLSQSGIQAAALLGSSLTDEQERHLDPFRIVTIAMDNDTPGREAAHKIADRLRPKHKINFAWLKG